MKLPITCSFEQADWCIFSQSATSNYPWKITKAGFIDLALGDDKDDDDDEDDDENDDDDDDDDVLKDSTHKSPNGMFEP